MTATAPAVSRPRGRAALGMALVALGVLWTLGNLGLLPDTALVRAWPLLAIAAGAFKVRQPPRDGQRAMGVALVGLGVFFQVQQLLSWRLAQSWPLLLVMAGGFLLWRAFDRRGAAPATDEAPALAELAFIGGARRALHTPAFQGGYVTVVLGGSEVDLRGAAMASSPAVVDVFALWGGIDIKVPPGWLVDAKGVPLIGGFEDKTQAPLDPAAAPRLVVRGYALMGAVEIHN
jgi:hypothetical protein